MDQKKISTVVVDDEHDIADYISKLIGMHFSEELSVTEFYSGSKALEYLKEHRCDLLITDICMPVVSGLDLLGYIAGQQADTEVILLTAHREFEYIYEANKKKQITYIIKSEREVSMLEVIQSVIKRILSNQIQKDKQEEVRMLFNQVHKLASSMERIQELDQSESAEQNELQVRFSSIRHYIRENIGGDVSLDTLAKKYHYHPAYLSKAFREAYGINLSNYVLECKISEAKKYLSKTDIAIVDLAELLGYQTAQSFIRAFRKDVGMSPQVWRHMDSGR